MSEVGGGARVTVAPSGIELEVGPGETVLRAAERQGVAWPTTCGGVAECRTCAMYVVDEPGQAADQPEPLDPPGALEAAALASITFSLQGDPSRWRLACQATVRRDVRVRKPGVRWAEA